MNIEQARFNMIEQQIRPWDVLDTHVLQLLASVKREDFVPLAHKAMAFVDMEIPLLGGGAQGQNMLSPKVEARVLQDLNIHKHEKVLEIGTGSGYMDDSDPEYEEQSIENCRKDCVMGIDEVSSVFLYLGTGLLLDGGRFFGWFFFEEEKACFCFGFK